MIRTKISHVLGVKVKYTLYHFKTFKWTIHWNNVCEFSWISCAKNDECHLRPLPFATPIFYLSWLTSDPLIFTHRVHTTASYDTPQSVTDMVNVIFSSIHVAIIGVT